MVVIGCDTCCTQFLRIAFNALSRTAVDDRRSGDCLKDMADIGRPVSDLSQFVVGLAHDKGQVGTFESRMKHLVAFAEMQLLTNVSYDSGSG